jgi:hypothetical protein
MEVLILLVFAGIVYFIPSLTAKGKPNFGPVFVINLFLGWSLIGWVVALAMATSKPSPPVLVQAGQPEAGPPTAPQVPAGWYPDPTPERPNRHRWWSGQAWTDGLRDVNPM